MALDKLVDSTQLDNNLTSVANAIRAKSGGTNPLAFPVGFVSEIGNISGGGQTEEPVDLPAIAEETTLKDYLAAHPIPLKYVNEILWVWFYSDDAPSSGGVTKWNQFWIEGSTKITMLSAYSNNNVSANSLGIGGDAISASSGSYFNIANGAITNSGSTNTSRKIAAGTTVKALHIPINYNTFSLESTLR